MVCPQHGVLDVHAATKEKKIAVTARSERDGCEGSWTNFYWYKEVEAEGRAVLKACHDAGLFPYTKCRTESVHMQK